MMGADEDMTIEELLKLAKECHEAGGSLSLGGSHLIDYLQRLIDAEASVKELAEVLESYEQWEADLIMTDGVWGGLDSLPKFTQRLYDNWLETAETLIEEKNNRIAKLERDNQNLMTGKEFRDLKINRLQEDLAKRQADLAKYEHEDEPIKIGGSC